MFMFMEQSISKTEGVFQKSKPIDKLNTFDGIALMVQEQKKAALEVKIASKSIEFAINKIYEHLTLNPFGRLIYVLGLNSVLSKLKPLFCFINNLGVKYSLL